MTSAGSMQVPSPGLAAVEDQTEGAEFRAWGMPTKYGVASIELSRPGRQYSSSSYSVTEYVQPYTIFMADVSFCSF